MLSAVIPFLIVATSAPESKSSLTAYILFEVIALNNGGYRSAAVELAFA